MTTVHIPTWEHRLLTLAHEAHIQVNTRHHSTIADQDLLKRAYACCESLTARHSRSFYLATRLLPPDKRRAMRALYAFCRTCDDIVDQPGDDPRGKLAAWRDRVLSAEPCSKNLMTLAWVDTQQRYNIPQRYAEQLIEGVARDLRQTRYDTFEELAAYAYGVASTVGLMSMHISGFAGPEAIPYAIKLGVALQLTNILRDVGEDRGLGRVYLPASELTAFGLSEVDLAAGVVDERWRAFMRFQIARNRRLYREALPGINLLHREGRLATAAAGVFYRAILGDIEAHDYDVFQRRAHVGTMDKLLMLPGIWWRWH